MKIITLKEFLVLLFLSLTMSLSSDTLSDIKKVIKQNTSQKEEWTREKNYHILLEENWCIIIESKTSKIDSIYICSRWKTKSIVSFVWNLMSQIMTVFNIVIEPDLVLNRSSENYFYVVNDTYTILWDKSSEDVGIELQISFNEIKVE